MLARLEGFVQEDGYAEIGRERGDLLPPLRAVAHGGAQHRRALDSPALEVPQYQANGQRRGPCGGENPLTDRDENLLGRGQREKRHPFFLRRFGGGDGGVMLDGPDHGDGFMLSGKFANRCGRPLGASPGVESEEKNVSAGDAPAVDSRHLK